MNKSAYNKNGQAWKKVAIAIAVSTVILLLGCAAMTGLVLGGRLQEEMIPIAGTGLLFGASLVGAVVASLGGEGFWVTLSSFTAIEYLLLLTINLCFFDGGLERIVQGSLAVVLGAAAALGLKWIPISPPANRKYKRRFR